jgi:hypothetical protein
VRADGGGSSTWRGSWFWRCTDAAANMRSSSGVLNTSATSSRVQSVRTTPRLAFHAGCCAAAVANARVPVVRSACGSPAHAG